MTKEELLEIGFKDTSFTDENETFTEHTLRTDRGFRIQVSGICFTEISHDGYDWIDVPSCKTIQDVKDLIRLFS